jgi:Ca2+/Na+ antiporter
MADDKKKAGDKKPGGTGPYLHDLVYLLGGLFLLALLLGQISAYFGAAGWGNINTVWNHFLYSYVFPLWRNWKYISVILSIACVFWFIYSYRRLKEIEDEEEVIFGPPQAEFPLVEELAALPKNERWEGVLAHLHSDNPSGWRLAIMEADIMLEETLRRNGFPGDTIGDMLKSAQPGDFRTLDAAWDAHKVRNRIAHSGSDFDLNEREAQRVIHEFEAVFQEFKII